MVCVTCEADPYNIFKVQSRLNNGQMSYSGNFKKQNKEPAPLQFPIKQAELQSYHVDGTEQLQLTF